MAIQGIPIEATFPLLESQYKAAVRSRVYLGTSSWSFPGWQMVFANEYKESQLAKAGLKAYARHPLLNAVGLDRSFYAPLAISQYAAYAADVPDNFRFLVKAPDLITGAQKRDEKGKPLTINPLHLEPNLAIDEFIGPASEGLGEKLGCLVFQFSPLPRSWLADSAKWIDRLGMFLSALPALTGHACYAVEIRDAALLTPRLMKVLAATNTTYCLGLHDRLPPLSRQLAAWDLLNKERQPERPDPAPLICRWTLRQGMTYQSARTQFSPFAKIHLSDDATMTLLAHQILNQQALGAVSLVIINNKAEGCAPISIQRLDAALSAQSAAHNEP